MSAIQMTALKVAFIWHMHQPWYLWPGSRQAALPFVRLHACGAYYDMPWLLRGFDKTTVTFNLVPSLTEQIARYARAETTDRALELSRRAAADLEPDERHYLLTCFSNYRANVRPQGRGRCAELRRKCRDAGATLTEADWRDLQVWLDLAWCGYALRSDSEVVRELLAKEKGFSEQEKRALLDEMQTAIGRVLDLYGSAESDGRAELTTSPYYHPILPLLCKMSDAERRIPRRQLPNEPWHAPAECQRQLERARVHHRATFGRRPEGLWPSEGAVSGAALALIEEAGFGWTASDEEVLAHSLRDGSPRRPDPRELYRPYRVAEGKLSIVFRDHYLSDRIGFVYADWSCEDAALDLVARLRRIASALEGSSTPGLVCIILDGENPWASYPDRGEGFLRSLYAALEADEVLETTSVGDYLREFPPEARLDSVFPGSWIDGSYRTWIGGEEHKRAWNLLRGALDATADHGPGEAAERAREHLMIAEGSDWFWWHSEQHHTTEAATFDALFRANVAQVYRELGEEEPAAVGQPIAHTEAGGLARKAVGLTRATIDGRVSDYFEWRFAAVLRSSILASEMHRSETIIREIFVGFDLENLWLRVDTDGRAASALRGCELHFLFPGDPQRRLSFAWPTEGEPSLRGGLADSACGAADKIVEVGLSLAALGLRPGETMELAVSLEREGQPQERWPQHGFLSLPVPAEELDRELWRG